MQVDPWMTELDNIYKETRNWDDAEAAVRHSEKPNSVVVKLHMNVKVDPKSPHARELLYNVRAKMFQELFLLARQPLAVQLDHGSASVRVYLSAIDGAQRTTDGHPIFCTVTTDHSNPVERKCLHLIKEALNSTWALMVAENNFYGMRGITEARLTLRTSW